MLEPDEDGDDPDDLDVDGGDDDAESPPDVNDDLTPDPDDIVDEDPPEDDEPQGDGEPAKKSIYPAARYKLRMRDDGTLSSAKGEQMCLLMADGVSAWKSWQLLGGKDWGGSGMHARWLKRNPIFIKRLDDLMTEKAELEKDPHYGSAKWQAAQMWRTARVLGDHSMAMEATKVLARLVEKSGVGMAAAAPVEPVIKAQPGKPSVDMQKAPSNGGEITAIRAELLRLGRPEKVEKVEDAA